MILPRLRQLHKRLVAACERVMRTGDLTEQAVVATLGKRSGYTLFNLHAETPILVANAGLLVGMADARWQGLGKPPEMVAALDELFAAIRELPDDYDPAGIAVLSDMKPIKRPDAHVVLPDDPPDEEGEDD